jgi:hypothetical protein
MCERDDLDGIAAEKQVGKSPQTRWFRQLRPEGRKR